MVTLWKLASGSSRQWPVLEITTLRIDPHYLMPAEITEHGVPRLAVGYYYRRGIDIFCRVLEDPETDLQPNVDPVKQAAGHDHSQLPTVCAQELGADSMRKEATLDLPKLSENDGFEDNLNPDNEPTPSQEISKPGMAITSPCCLSAYAFTPVPTICEDEDFGIDEIPQEGDSGDSGDNDLPIFEG